MNITFLGTGTSTGVPVVGCTCAVCTSDDPRNRRLRPSVLVEIDGHRLLIDAGPDLRFQLLRAGVDRIEALAITHEHADHVHGLDDVRPLCHALGRAMPMYATERVAAVMRARFAYAFRPWGAANVPALEPRTLTMGEPARILGARVWPLPVDHAGMEVTALRFERWAYVVDAGEVPDATLERLHDLDLLVLDALRPRPHPSHLSLGEALAIVERLRPRRTLFTHMTHDVDHARESERLPDGVAFAVDGQVVEV